MVLITDCSAVLCKLNDQALIAWFTSTRDDSIVMAFEKK